MDKIKKSSKYWIIFLLISCHWYTKKWKVTFDYPKGILSNYSVWYWVNTVLSFGTLIYKQCFDGKIMARNRLNLECGKKIWSLNCFRFSSMISIWFVRPVNQTSGPHLEVEPITASIFALFLQILYLFMALAFFLENSCVQKSVEMLRRRLRYSLLLTTT